jgi:hypothetical protein
VLNGKATAKVTVQAAPWISVSKVTLYVNGQEVKTWTVPPSQETVRLKETFEFPVSRDSWVVARVDGDKSMEPVVGDSKRFTVYPFALTNPVFLDSDGNGLCDPLVKHGSHAP